ncbi:mitochondrial amidoxime-reducing component 1 [Lingula anatina]|uniref:Mitochondrial amidoxime-reducing component 1 n=1 Tax=Lingula anatina TaxID=7574 RepID=A0A1S3J3T6_LINAN|nr:mitochondrial amidoxime-reducing component 1 [Lingula anatina]|eukprot:XP_013404529.1 mitochondrial amidoxime-reducing component 1 [Lingula anatina]
MEVDEAACIFASLLLNSVFKFITLYWINKKRRSEPVCVGEISSLYVYPVKSCAGIKVEEMDCTRHGSRTGAVTDRHWMIVDKNGKFLSQRKLPRLALVQPSITGNKLSLDAPGMNTLKLDILQPVNRDKIVKCSIWDVEVSAMSCGAEADKWFSAFLQRPDTRLVCAHPDITDCMRQLNKNLGTDPVLSYPKDQDVVAFADWAPFMLLSENSIADVNTRLSKKVEVRNFRPNFLVKDCGAYAEDSWHELYIGKETKFRNVRLGTRCTLTTVDPDKGEKDKDMEPLKTLRNYRLHPGCGDAPVFAINLVVDNVGKVCVGDKVFATMF